MDVPNTKRIILLGKTGTGKSSLANTILGEATFKVNHFSDLEIQLSQSKTKSVNGRSLTLIDTPGFLGPDRSEVDIKTEILSCIIECAPGPHAFLFVLKVEKFTEHEQAVVTQMCETFSEDALNHTIVVFTHGDQLAEGMKIEKYISQSEGLSDLVKKCGGRCHVFDSKYWKSSQEDEYRSNQYQVAELLDSIDEIVMENNGGYYTNTMLQAVEKEIQKEEGRIRRSSKNLSQDEIRKQAKANILKKKNAALPWIKWLAGLAVAAGLFATASVVVIKFVIPAITPAITLPVTPEIVPEVIPDITPAIPSEIIPDITSEIIPDITPEIIPEIIPDITPEIIPEIIPDITPAIPSEIIPEIIPAITPAITLPVTPEIVPEAIPDITPAIPSEITPDITPAIPSEITPDITPAIPSEIIPDITPAIPSEIIPDITSEIIPDITPAIPPAILPEESVEKTFLTILNNLWALFERTYDPFNLFE